MESWEFVLWRLLWLAALGGSGYWLFMFTPVPDEISHLDGYQAALATLVDFAARLALCVAVFLSPMWIRTSRAQQSLKWFHLSLMSVVGIVCILGIAAFLVLCQLVRHGVI